jgi:hypothetical protein
VRNPDRKNKETLSEREAFARQIQREFPQNRRGGYGDISAEQYDDTRYTSAEPSVVTFAKIKKLREDELQVE